MRIGYGYDSHVFTENREFILGGVKVPYKLGLKGHSDADVLSHAIIDAIFGALALGDIGSHFPDTDNKYKDISSIILLKETIKIMKNNDYRISNIDSTVICEKPKLREYIDIIRENLSSILEINISDISIKAKTNEKMDDVGNEKGIVVHSMVLLTKIK